MKAAATLFGLAACAVYGQPSQTSASGAPVFYATTKLIQVSVIAQYKDGKPVADLRREDFLIFDNGAPREIRLFVAERPLQAVAPNRPPNTFSNLTALPQGEGGGAGFTVLLFDTLSTGIGDPFTGEGGWGVAKEQAFQALRALPPGGKVAIYALARDLKVIQEFTLDRESLEKKLRAWKPDVDSPATAMATINDALAHLPKHNPEQAALALRRQLEEVTRIDGIRRASLTGGELGDLAEHLAGIPGRKNLIWLAQKFPLAGRTLQKLANAGVVVYPVDVGGVCDPTLCPPRPVEQMITIAQATGGLAYFHRNDLDVAMHDAAEDGRWSYTLGFYQSGDDKLAAEHRLNVKVSRAGVALRYAAVYLAEPSRPPSASPAEQLVQAMNRPRRYRRHWHHGHRQTPRNRLELPANFDLANLDLEPIEGLWKGQVEVVARFITADAPAGDAVAETVTFKPSQKPYESMLGSGFSYRKQELAVPPKAVALKLLVGNLATGKFGTVTIPLAAVAEAP